MIQTLCAKIAVYLEKPLSISPSSTYGHHRVGSGVRYPIILAIAESHCKEWIRL